MRLIKRMIALHRVDPDALANTRSISTVAKDVRRVASKVAESIAGQ
jgi:hypothetical protein